MITYQGSQKFIGRNINMIKVAPLVFEKAQTQQDFISKIKNWQVRRKTECA